MSYKHQSGSQKRLKRKHQEESVNKLPKITSFFSSPQLQADSTSDCSTSKQAQVPANDGAIPATSEDTPSIADMADAEETESPESNGSTSDKSTTTTSEVQQQIRAESEVIPISKWPEIITDKFIERIIVQKPISDILIGSEQVHVQGGRSYKRSLHENHFYKVKVNGGKEKRDWLIYDATAKALYCYYCKLFSREHVNLSSTGVTNWKHVAEYLKSHEESKNHLKCAVSLLTRSSLHGVVDVSLRDKIVTESEYWSKILQRIVETIKFLARQGIAFRGSTENINDRGRGNYLSSLVYLAKFDEFLSQHLKFKANRGKGRVSYLSHTICDEFLQIMRNKLERQFVEEVKTAKYYSIIVDSTPDISHQDQLTFIIRYLKAGVVIERFFGFIALENHTAAHIAEIVIKKINDLGLDIRNCRGQAYDNASNMSGRYNGLQAKIRELSVNAIYVPCTNHSLNLVINSASESSLEVSDYFSTVQGIFTFFSASPQRWKLLTEAGCNLKRLIETRWSARYEAVNNLSMYYKLVKDIFLKIIDNPNEKPITRNEATALHQKMDSFEMLFLTLIWKQILYRMNVTSKTLESVDMNICEGVSLLKSLSSYIEKIRNSFEDLENEAKDKVSKEEYKYRLDTKRCKKRKAFFDEITSEESSEANLTGRDNLRTQIFYILCDALLQDIARRVVCYEEVNVSFQCFFSNEDDKIKKSIRILKEKYSADIEDSDNLENEFYHFGALCENLHKKSISEKFNIIQNAKATFPNILTLLEIYLTIPVSNASGERSFSVLKRIKNYLRSCMGSERLDALCLLYIESLELEKMECDDLIRDFASAKSRKMLAM